MKKIILYMVMATVVITLGALAYFMMAEQGVGELTAAAQAQYDAGNHDEAVKTYFLVLAQDPNNVQAFKKLAELAKLKGDKNAAANFWASVVKLDPLDRSAVREQAVNLLGTGKFQQVIELLEAETDSDLTPDETLLLAQARFQAGDIDKAEALTENVLNQRKNDPRALILQAHLSFTQRNFDGAAAAYQNLLKNDAVRSGALIGLGNCALIAGDPKKAENYFKQAVEAGAETLQARGILANHYRQQGDFDKAAAIWEALLEQHPGSPGVILSLAECYMAGGKGDALKKIGNQVKMTGPATVALRHYIRGLNAISDDNLKAAQKSFELCRNIMGKRPLYRWLRFNMAVQSENFETVAEIVQEALAKKVNKTTLDRLGRLLTASATNAWDRKKYNTVRSWCENLVRLNPDDRFAHRMLAREALATNNPERAVKIGGQLLKSDASDATALETRGLAYLKLEKYDLASADFNTLHKLIPESFLGPYWIGVTARMQGDLNKSRDYLELAYQKRNNDPRVVSELYDVYTALKKPDKARLLAQELIARDNPTLRSVGYAFAAALYRRSGESEKADQALRNAIEESPDRIPYYLTRGDLLIKLKRYDEAEQVLEEALSRSTDTRYALFKLAFLEQQRGNRDEAVKRYRELQRRYPTWAIVLVNLSELLSQDPATAHQAVAPARDAVTHSSGWYASHLALARSLHATGKADQAREILKNALKRFPNQKEIQDELKRDK